jgi:hypothetical protein
MLIGIEHPGMVWLQGATMIDRDYVYVRAWARFMGWPSERITDALTLARNDHAPDDACYKQRLHWVRHPEIISNGVRMRIEKLADAIRKGH